MFLVPLVVFLGVKFGFRKSCLCKRNDKYEVWTSIDELEENYASKPEWKVIEGGGVLSVPVEEFRMINPPKPDHSGKLEFGKRKESAEGKHIDSYPVCQTIDHLNKVIEEKFSEMFEKISKI